MNYIAIKALALVGLNLLFVYANGQGYNETTLTIEGNVVVTIETTLINSGTIDVKSNGELELQGSLNNSSGTADLGNGELVINHTSSSLTGNIIIEDLTIGIGATANIPTNSNITVQGTLNNDGTLTVNNGAALVQEPGSTLSGSGSYIVERSINGGVTFVASPISNIAVSDFGITPTGTNGGQIIPNAVNPCNPDSIDVSSAYGNLLELRENPIVLNNCAQSLWFVKSSGNLINGRGYSLNNAATTLSYAGTINNGTVSYTGLTRQSGNINQQDGSSSTRGWHLVGNPYPSPITLTGADLTAMGFDAQIQRYNEATGDFFPNDPLVSVDIAVGQGFQIRKTSIGGISSFILDNSFRTTGNPTYYRQQSPRQHYLNITLSNGIQTDNTMIYFYQGATDGFDPLYDANRLMGNYSNPLLYSVADSERLSYNAYPIMGDGEERIVPLGVHSGNENSFALTFNNVATLEVEELYLEDTKLNTISPITEGMVYTFLTEPGDANERFNIIFKKAEEQVPTAISQLNDHTVKLYPNPAGNTVQLQLEPGHGYTRALIVDVLGHAVGQMPIDGKLTNYTLPLNQLGSGVYYAQLIGPQASTVIRFVKQ